ncbi:uncharacterized protein LOC127721609 isoform X1 [Mytilus californianus]|uniref:uncharacterized protein LOC127721609 isoform X1 n=2 Tax=Mytilus californianus TaxID=6549 RepID=UPI0022477137|nr:uncharacterized protein LOC127721609 isoform X1 [Mytilus californianus]
MSGFLKYICLFNQKERYSPLWSVNNFQFKRDGKHNEEICALHNSESSLSHIGSMETLIDAPSIAEDNPEVMLDFLTMQSLRDRYNEKDLFEVELTAQYVNEQDFDNYVREFVIDDAISECFAASEDSSPIFSFPFQKSSNSPAKQNRLKKKLVHKSPQEEMILSDEDSRSSDSKRSKLIGNIFNRKQKGKENMKPIKEPDPKENGDITGAIIDACEHITNTYKQPTGKPDSTISEKSPKKDSNKNQGIVKNGSIIKESDNVSRRTSVGNRSRDSSSSRRLPPVPSDSSRSENSMPRRKHSTASSTGTSRRTPKKSETLIDELLSKSDADLASTLNGMSYDSLRKTRDRMGDTVLHRCVKEDKTTSTKTLSTKYPQMCSELNNDRLSPLEYSVKLGKCDCMLILLEKSRSDGVLESLTVPRLLNMAAQYDQSECLESLLNLLPKGEGNPLELPPDSLGNTAAHEATSKGHLRCLQILLDNGYDVWSKNSEGLCPIQLAIHNHHTECYGFMLLFESSRCLASEAAHQYNKAVRLRNSKMSNYDAFVMIESQLSRYQEQLNEAMRSTLESQENILVTLDCIYDQLAAVLASMDDASELTCHLETIKGESERLQDLFDFSVIANANSMLSRLLTDFREVLKDADGKEIKDGTPDKKPYINFRASYKDMIKIVEHDKGENFETKVQKHMQTFIDKYKLPEQQFSDKESTSNSSSSTSNRTFTITKKSLKLPSFTIDTTHHELPQNNHDNSNKEENTQKSPSKLKRGNTKTKSLKGRSPSQHKSEVVKTAQPDDKSPKDGRKENRNHSQRYNDDRNNIVSHAMSSPEVPLLESPSATESVYSSTLTSDQTVTDQFSDWTSRTETLRRESCDSGSEWWQENNGYYNEEEDDIDDGHSRVRLNVDNEDLPDEMLRQHRLNQHLKSVEKINAHRTDVIETVITASGRQLGRSNPSKVPKPAPRPSLNKEQPKYNKESKRGTSIFSKIKNKSKVKLFSAEDVGPSREISQSEFLESYDRSRDGAKNDLKWDEVSLTDGEEYKTNEKPWYEMSEDEESLLQGWKTDDEDENARDFGNL